MESQKEKKPGLLKQTNKQTKDCECFCLRPVVEKLSFRPVKFEMSFEYSNRDIQVSRFEFQGRSSD